MKVWLPSGVRHFFFEYVEFLRRYKAWFLYPLLLIVLFVVGMLLLRGDDLPVYFTYAIF